MAYNPFTWFRKNQKTLFAVLTIIIMFVFIAQFGAGDIMHYVNFWFSSGRAAGPEVTRLGSRTVFASDIELLTSQRDMANRFLAETIQSESQSAVDKLLNKLKTLEEGSPLIALRDILETHQANRRIEQQLQGRLQQQMLMLGGQLDADTLARLQAPFNQQLQQIRASLITMLRDPNTGLPAIAARDKVKDNHESLDLIMQAGSILGADVWRISQTRPDAFLMGGTREPESILDFMLWQQQADRLGITITDEDLAKQINRDLGGIELFEPGTGMAKNKRLIQFASGGRNREQMKPTALVEALREEYRVALAQSLLLGFEPGIRGWRSLITGGANPTTGTPDEFLQFVRNYRTTVRVQAMPVSIEPFISKVDQQPAETELERLFTRFRDQEPSPVRRTPGFKLPRRVRAAYVIGNVETPSFREAGVKWANLLMSLHEPFRQAKQIALAPCLSPLGAGPLAPSLAILRPMMNDPVQRQYQEYVKTTEAWVFSPDDFGAESAAKTRLQLSSAMQPVALSAMIATPATGMPAGLLSGGPLAMLNTLFTHATANEYRGALRFTAARILASAPAQPGWPAALTAVSLSLPYKATPLPLDTVRPIILANIQERISRERVHLAVDQLREELAEKKEKLDVAKRAKELNLEFHEMPQAVSQLALEEADRTPGSEKGLTAFRDIFRREGQQDFGFAQVGAVLFQGQGTFKLERSARFMRSDTILRSGEKEELLAWRIEDLNARVRSFEEARADVLQAWRVEKARDQARNRAIAIRDQINKEKLTPADALRVLKENRTGDLFTLDGVARLTPPREIRPEARTDYRPYEVPDSLQKVLPYPPADLAKLLTEMKRPGEAMVFVDAPARTFFVTVLEARDEPSVADFKNLYGRTPFRDPLFDSFQQERQLEYRKNVVQQLRREAGAKLDREGNYELPEVLKRGQNADEMPR
jgi:hypothetical protein